MLNAASGRETYSRRIQYELVPSIWNAPASPRCLAAPAQRYLILKQIGRLKLQQSDGLDPANLPSSPPGGSLHFPVDAISFVEDFAERNQCRFFSFSGSAENEGLSLNRLDPGHRTEIALRLHVHFHRAFRCATRSQFRFTLIGVVLHLLAQPLRTQTASHDHRTIEDCLLRSVARQSLQVEAHGEVNFKSVAVRPGAIELQITSGARKRRERFAIKRGGTAVHRPVRDAHIDSSLGRSAGLHD